MEPTADAVAHLRRYTVKVIIGAGKQAWDGWIPTQGDELNLLEESTWSAFFQGGKADALLYEHVFEHLTLEEGKNAAKTIFDYLESCYAGNAGSINEAAGKGGAGRGLFQIMETAVKRVANDRNSGS